MASQFDPQTLAQIGRYPVVRFLAEGGMSWVFEVSDPEMFDRRVALKLIKPHVLAEGEMLKRYEDEVRLLARIEHPNMVRVYAQGTDPETGARFFTMEFIEGPHLGEVAAEWLIEPGQTTVGVTIASLAEIGDFFLGILSALARVHSQGVFHRDIKPENILITQDGIAKLADFSIARDTHKAGVTRAGLVPGTPQYMSPEQSLDETVGATSDLFSLGLTLYRVLTGRSIYAIELGDETKTQQVIRHLWALYTNKGEFQFEFPGELPPAFHEVIRRACRIDPAGRYQTAHEMREALAGALSAPHRVTGQVRVPERIPTPPRSSAPRPRPEPDEEEAPPRLRRGLVLAVAGAASVALLGGLVAVLGIPRPPWGDTGDAAVELRDKTRGRSKQVTGLVEWLSARPDEPARALVAQTGGDLRRFNEGLEEAEADLRDGYEELALRQLDRANQGFAALCDRFTNEYLETARADAEGAARDDYARVTDEARSLAAEQAVKLDAAFERLSAEIGARGCERAEGMRVRVETAAEVRELAADVQRTAQQEIPVLVAAAIQTADDAAERARAPAITNEHYVERLREGEDALASARTAQAAGEWRSALDAAKRAQESLERTALIGSAVQARAGAEQLVQELDAIEAPLGAMRLSFDSAQRSFLAGEWQQASTGFASLTPELEARLAAATPVVEVARSQAAACVAARSSGEDVTEIEHAELDARAKFGAAKFDEAIAAYQQIEARCGQVLVASADRKAQDEARRVQEAELRAQEEERLRREGERLDQEERARRQAEAEREQARKAAEAEREQALRAAESARSRAQQSLARLASAKIGAASLEPEARTASDLLDEQRFVESEAAYRKLESSAEALAKRAKGVLALRDQVEKEFRAARTAGVPEGELASGTRLREAGAGLLAEGNLDGARAKLDGALASYKQVRGEVQARQAEELAALERKRDEERAARQAEEQKLAARRDAASKPRDQLARSVSELQSQGLPLGPVAAARSQAQAEFDAKRYEEAASAFERANTLAREQLAAGKPVLEARKGAEAARESALARGASGKPLAAAAQRFEAAAAQLAAGKLPGALEGFRAATASYDAAEADPEEVIKLLFANWDLAWSERDVGLLRRTQSLSAAQEQGFAKVFDDNDAITQRTRVLGFSKAGANAYEVQVEYSRVLKAGASEKRQDAQRRVARVEKSGNSWIIASVSQ